MMLSANAAESAIFVMFNIVVLERDMHAAGKPLLDAAGVQVMPARS